MRNRALSTPFQQQGDHEKQFIKFNLLVPSSRPPEFLRGVQEYDEKSVGLVWDTDRESEFKAEIPTLMVHDNRRDGLTNRGHDKNLIVDGKQYRLDWSAPDLTKDLENLLEFMKTL